METNEMIAIVKLKTQKFGTFLSGMIMPIVGVIVAWGLLTAFFIPTGWTPVAVINEHIVGNMITYLIPTLIGFLGGKLIYGERGGWIGAASAAGVIGGAQMFEAGVFYPIKDAQLGPQFLGAMIAGPLGAFILKKTETLWDGKVKPGYEMLVNNFSMGIMGMGIILFSFFVIPWGVFALTFIFEGIINPMTKARVLPLVSLLVEPLKPLFLNNAINHGVFTPLAINEVADSGKSILFYIESNPGPGMGLLMAYAVWDKKERGNASAASAIHFFGGIHEVYFPFILMKPILVLSTMAGGAVGTALMQMFGAGAVSPASPGSIIALYAVSSSGGLAYAGLTLGIFGGMATSFAVASFILKVSKKNATSSNEAIIQMNEMKNSESKYVKVKSTTEAQIISNEIKTIIFACDAGMGSSAMGAGLLRKMIKDAGLDIEVTNKAIRDLTDEKPDLIIVQSELATRAKKENPAEQFIVKNFMDKSKYAKLIDGLK